VLPPQWIATGAIECVDAGGHRRPNHHAQLGRTTFRAVERALGDPAACGGPATAVLGRRLQAKLPSFGSEFTQSVPLTRIRDIAHRCRRPQPCDDALGAPPCPQLLQ
jgi:phosphoglucan,water dikinase